jgi:predicted dinucleotide-binding enzyme
MSSHERPQAPPEDTDITIVGTGRMARGIGTLALAGGYKLTLVGRRPERAKALAEALRESGKSIQTAEADDAPLRDVVVLAVYFPEARVFLEKYGHQLAGQVVVDISNPINDTYDGLIVPPDSSATQELASLAPDARVVKAFNTTFAATLLAGEVADHQLDVLIAGDDEHAKAAVAALAQGGGLNPIDVGAQHRARELEALGLLHIRLQDTLGTGFSSAVKFVV